jgi:hypothetical protein
MRSRLFPVEGERDADAAPFQADPISRKAGTLRFAPRGRDGRLASESG